MMLYNKTAKGPFDTGSYIDPDAVKRLEICYIPPTWSAATVYYQQSDTDYSVVIPTVFAGLYYRCRNPGLSGATEPTWPTKPGSKVVDGSVIWEAVAYDLITPALTITLSTWTSNSLSATLASDAISGGMTSALASTVPSTLTSVTFTNHVTFSNGEEDDMTILFKVAQR